MVAIRRFDPGHVPKLVSTVTCVTFRFREGTYPQARPSCQRWFCRSRLRSLDTVGARQGLGRQIMETVFAATVPRLSGAEAILIVGRAVGWKDSCPLCIALLGVAPTGALALAASR